MPVPRTPAALIFQLIQGALSCPTKGFEIREENLECSARTGRAGPFLIAADDGTDWCPKLITLHQVTNLSIERSIICR